MTPSQERKDCCGFCDPFEAYKPLRSCKECPCHTTQVSSSTCGPACELAAREGRTCPHGWHMAQTSPSDTEGGIEGGVIDQIRARGYDVHPERFMAAAEALAPYMTRAGSESPREAHSASQRPLETTKQLIEGELVTRATPTTPWGEELRRMLDRNIAVDGGAVATKYRHEVEDFISSTIESEIVRERMRCHGILHEHFMASKDKNVLDVLEAAQHKILNNYEPRT